MNTEQKKKVILVIEDDPSFRDALKDMLESEGFMVFLASTGEDGVAQALREHPDLILLDLLLPKMSGVEVAQRLRADVWGKHAKVIVFSNIGDADHVSAALEEGVFEYLVKANTPLKRLVEKIREMVG